MSGVSQLPLAKHDNIQAGPLPVISGVITPISRVITPVTIYKAIYRGYN